MTVTKIISGGQTGADQGGLAAGKCLGLETGGTAPPKFWTEKGPNPELLEGIFGLVEGLPDPKLYPKRTERNVLDSNGTVLFGNKESSGSKLTDRFCQRHERPLYWFLDPKTHADLPWGLESFRFWIDQNNISILNVAGNRESKNPGIHEAVRDFLVKALDRGELR